MLWNHCCFQPSSMACVTKTAIRAYTNIKTDYPKKTAPYHDVEDLTCSPNKLCTVMQWMTLVARLSLYSETVNKCKQRITKARKRMHIMMARMTPFSLHFARCTDSPCSIEPVKIPCLTDHSSLAPTSRWMDSNSGSLAQRASDTTD